MAIDDFEWEAAGEATQPGRARLTGSEVVGTERAGWLASLKQSVWLEPALRLLGMTLLLGVLAGIGVVATTYAKPGLQLPEGSRVLADALGTSWLKPSPLGQRATSPAPAASASPSATASSSAPASPSGVAPAPSPSAPPVEASSGSPPAGITPEGKVILNLASAEELTRLPGVGMKRATAIVALRAKLKRFKRATDLLRVKGIGPRGLQRMLPHLVLDAPLAS
jgi:competence protein ComEA